MKIEALLPVIAWAAIFGGCAAGIRWVAMLPPDPTPPPPPCPTAPYAVVTEECEQDAALNRDLARMSVCGYAVDGKPVTASNWMGCETTIPMRKTSTSHLAGVRP